MTAIAKTDKATIERYTELLATVLPKLIETEAENECALEIVNRLMSKSSAVAAVLLMCWRASARSARRRRKPWLPISVFG